MNADDQANRIVVSLPTALVPVAVALVDAVDKPAATGAVEVRVFSLSRGDAESVASALRESLSAGLSMGEAPPVVTPEPTANAVVVAASTARLATAAAMIETLDATVEPDAVGVRTVFLKHARAEAVTPIIESLLAGEEQDNRSRRSWWWDEPESDEEPIKVAAEPRLNAVVLTGPVGLLEVGEQIVRELDADGASAVSPRPLRVITLDNADATTIAESVVALFEGAGDAADGSDRCRQQRPHRPSNARAA